MEKRQYSYQDGNLIVNGRVYRRPCDWAADCGPVAFLGGTRPWTPAAKAALIFNLQSSDLRPLRGLPDDFLVYAIGIEGPVPTVCGICRAPTTLTVRFEDVWLMLQPESRAYSYACAVTRDPHSKDVPSAHAEGIVREFLPGLAPDARICLDLAANGGFVLSFHPET